MTTQVPKAMLDAATQAELTAATNTAATALANAATAQATAAAITPAFTKSYESPAQTITAAGTLTLTHGLGVTPKLYQAFLVCQTAEQGYSIGDEVAINPHTNLSASTDQGLVMVPSSASIFVRFGAGNTGFVFLLLHKTTGVRANATNANWKLIIREYA